MYTNDYNFLLNATGLSSNKLDTLIEEDFNILIDSISSIPIDKVVTDISLDLYSKLSICKITKKLDYKLAEKFYVADSVSSNYSKSFNNSYYFIDNVPITESTAKFYLILLGMFEDRIKSNKKFYENLTISIFIENDKEDIADHFFNWLDILKELSTYWKISPC